MILNIFHYTIKIEKNVSEEEIIKKALEYKRIEEEFEKAKYKYIDYLNIR